MADATKPANITAPNRTCSRATSFASTAKTSETKNANSASSRIWLRIASDSLPAERDVVGVDDYQQVHQSCVHDKRVAVLVGNRAHVAGSVAERLGQKIHRA